MEINLDNLLKEVLHNQSLNSEKTTTKPIYEPTEFRRFFLEVLANEVKKRGRTLQINDETKRAINLICQYMNNEQQFLENEGFTFNKGLWLYGAFGSGKTVLMLTYREVKRILFKETVGFKTCVQMNEAFMHFDKDAGKINGELGIASFANKLDTTERIFDDLGEEETTVQHFGNKFCVMGKILTERYKGFPNTKTHITTNVSRKRLPELYGGRVDSRVYEMFNLIVLGKSRDSIDHRKT